MSLLLAILIGASAAPAGDMPAIDPRAGQPANCPATSRYQAARRGKTPRAQKLSELPDADVYATVYRHIGRCEAPIIVKFGVAAH